MSANLHVSEDGTHMINYAQWRDKKSFDAFLQDEHQDSLQKAIQDCKSDKVESDNFDLVAQQSIEDQFWSKPRF